MVERLEIDLGDRSYSIFCGPGMISKAGSLLQQTGLGKKCMVVSNKTVADLYWPLLQKSLEGAGFEAVPVMVADGEGAKSLATAGHLYDACLDAGIDRSGGIIALGGGVIGDLAGFVAATWLRGVGFIQVPTTLLAQVDASVGGKVAVNHPRGKNLIGSFYQPLAVIADQDSLSTLPRREISSGMAEVIKYGVIADRLFFEYLEKNMEAALAGDREILKRIVLKCCAIKGDIVTRDERESGLRAVLNFGHTIGHAVENLTGYTAYRHGEGVAIGMVAAARLAVARGDFDHDSASRLVHLLVKAGLPVELPPLEPERLRQVLERDKKMKQGQFYMVLPEKLGKVGIVPVTWDEVESIIQDGGGKPDDYT